MGKICDKRSKEMNDGESDLEEARVSRNLFDLFEHKRTSGSYNTCGLKHREQKRAQKASEEQDQKTQEKTKNHEGERPPLDSVVDEDLLRCGLCGKTKVLDKIHGHVPTALHDRETGRMVGQNM